MNIFVVDPNPSVAARMLCDQHVVKMPTECVQIICTAHACQVQRAISTLVSRMMHVPSNHAARESIIQSILARMDYVRDRAEMPYKPVRPVEHKQHPVIEWVQRDPVNLQWLIQHAWALTNEYKHRFGKEHAAASALQEALDTKRQGLPWRYSSGRQRVTPAGIANYDSRWLRMNFVQVMPVQYQQKRTGPKSTIRAYRKFYVEEKSEFARWANGRPPPDWWPFSTSVPPHGNLEACPDKAVASVSTSP